MSAYAPLIKALGDWEIDAEGVAAIRDAYVDCLEAEQPHAKSEAFFAWEIGLNVVEIDAESQP